MKKNLGKMTEMEMLEEITRPLRNLAKTQESIDQIEIQLAQMNAVVCNLISLVKRSLEKHTDQTNKTRVNPTTKINYY